MNEAYEIYNGSDGDATQQFYADLREYGTLGEIAVNLFRAQKCSQRAKKYRGGNGRASYRQMAYDKKNWSIGQLADILCAEGEQFGLTFGWREDEHQEYHKWVFYVDLPTGQCSFHIEKRGIGPDYTKPWRLDSASATAIISFCQKVFDHGENFIPSATDELDYAIANAK